MNYRALILGSPSDSHTWNLFYLNFLMKELGFKTEVLGGGLTYEEVSDAASQNWDLILVSSINGHFLYEAADTINAILKGVNSEKTPLIVAGGKIDVVDSQGPFIDLTLKKMGFNEVFFGPESISKFRTYLNRISFSLKLEEEKYA